MERGTLTLPEILARCPLLADGAMGTVLLARGDAADGCVERLNLTSPDEIVELHRAYVAAGAEVVCTNTFAANRLRLRAHGLADEVARINAAGAALARQAVSEAPARVLVAGDIGPLGARLAPYGRLQPEQAVELFVEQIEVLVRSAVDLLVLETFADVRELLQAVRAARKVATVPVVATMTFTRDDCTLLGETPAEVVRKLVDGGADLVGVNCAGGPAQALRLIRRMRAAVPDARLAVKPNAGWPEQIGGRLAYPATPAYFARSAVELVSEGVVLVGGCCGTTPEHVAAMRDALADRPQLATSPHDEGVSRPVAVLETRHAGEGGGLAAAESVLAQRLASGARVITVEMSPPKGLNTRALLAAAHLLKEAGADAINVADSPRARMRMSPWAVAHLIQREVGLDTVLHFPLRGRNLLRVQGDLLAAHALGLRNLFAVMGDPTAIGDHPGATDTYDLVPSGLIRLVKQGLNAGVDQAGAGIGEPTAFFVGCALNLAAVDVDKDVRSLRKKLESGADFVLTQPVYDAETARTFVLRYEDRYGALAVPVIAGVLPLFGERHATFLHNEVPGISIPAETRERIRRGGRDEGVRIAVEIAAALRGVAQGIYLMPPFAKWDMAAEIIEGLKREV